MGNPAINISIDVKDNALKRGNLTNVPIDRTDGKWTIERELEFLKQHHIRVAKETLREELGRGFDENYKKYVDSVLNKLQRSR